MFKKIIENIKKFRIISSPIFISYFIMNIFFLIQIIVNIKEIYVLLIIMQYVVITVLFVPFLYLGIYLNNRISSSIKKSLIELAIILTPIVLFIGLMFLFQFLHQ